MLFAGEEELLTQTSLLTYKALLSERTKTSSSLSLLNLSDGVIIVVMSIYLFAAVAEQSSAAAINYSSSTCILKNIYFLFLSCSSDKVFPQVTTIQY